MPLLILCYIANFIDRANVGIAQVHLSADLGITSTAYGIGVGIFFLGFILFEIPSNLFLDRYGVRKTLLRIMVLWGLVTSCTMFIQNATHFYIVRFLLGAAEAGFFPGVILYLTYWFPPSRRARIAAIFFLAPPIANAIGPPSSGWIMEYFDGWADLRGWQWMFLLQGIPTILLGVVAFFYLPDRPKDATWLTSEERAIVQHDLDSAAALKAHGHEYGFREMLRDPRVYVLGALVCGTYTLANAISYWTPLMLKESGVERVFHIGLLAGIPPIIAIAAMLAYARHSDRTGERRWHFAATQFTGAAALIFASLYLDTPVMVFIAIALMMSAHYSGISVFQAIPTIYLSEKAKAGGIALVNTIGAFGAMSAPVMLGWLADRTGSLSAGLQVSAIAVCAGGILCLLAIPSRLLRER